MTTFLLASLLLGLSPGPGVLYIVTRSLAQGRRAGLVSAAAMAVGNLVCGVAVSGALAAVVGISSSAFKVLRYAGAAYLLYLGVRMIISSRGSAQASAPPAPQRRIFADGLLVALLNPKTLVFFIAFLPQFMDATKPTFLQGSGLAVLFVLIAYVTDSGYALAASWVARPLQQSHRTRAMAGVAGGSVFIALAAMTLLA